MKRKNNVKIGVNQVNQKQKGITLVALVVTIIILLILAGVSLKLIAGSNGILGKAKNAVDVTKLKAVEESIELAIVASYDISGNIEKELLYKNLSNIEGYENIQENENSSIVKINGFEFEIAENGMLTSLNKDAINDENTENNGTVDSSQMTELQKKVQMLEKKVGTMDNTLTTVNTTATNAALAADTAKTDMNHLDESVNSLSSSLLGLTAKLKTGTKIDVDVNSTAFSDISVGAVYYGRILEINRMF